MKLDAFFKTLGYDITESVNWDSKVRQWESWYRGKIASFHNYTIYNGIKDVKMSRKSLQMAKKVCEDWANLLFNEKVTITLGTDADTKKLEDVFNGNNLWQGINQAVEKTFAGGMGAFVVSLNDLSYDENTGLFIVDDKSKLKVDFVSARKIKPLSWDSNGIKECAFASQMYIKGKEHYAISVHKLNDKGNYVIKNYLLEVCGSTYKDITSTVDTLADEFDTQSPVAWFSIYTPNICNNIVIDDLSPFGISVFANAIDTLQSIDIIYDSFANEFMLGRKRIFIAAETMKFDAEGQKFTFDPNDIVFQQLPKDIKSENLVQEINASLRVEEHTQGIETQLNILSSKCGFGEKFYKFDGQSVATATQVISENSSLFRTIKKHEIALEECLDNLIQAIAAAGSLSGLCNIKTDEIVINFDDSIIEDKNAERMRDLQEVNAGIMDKWEYRVKWYAETEKDAKAKVPQLQTLDFLQ